ncbi:MAG TPA: SUMF1/EgtB/PvdO family nonheme iron enzyme [Thermoanaerobaculia bacterium]|nr:SUMF1/EgtB/PvdO family nonheme iron enzyme [Thermoanaerobaculia bacterium]
MSAALGLDPLLAALREAGLPVGVAEVARLQRVFALGPQLEEDRRLKAILRSVLVKSAEDRARFEPIFDAWLSRARGEVSFREAPLPVPGPDPVADPVPTSPPRHRPAVWRILAAAALPLLVLMLGDEVRQTPPSAPKMASPTKPPVATPVSTARALTPAEIRKRSFTTWVPSLTVTPAEQEWRGWPAISLGSLALLAAVALWLNVRKQAWMPEPAPEPARKGPPRVFLTLPELSGPQLLEPREQEALVWGIGHFVAEEPTRRLDLTATVRETAQAGGFPHLRFHQARYPREVWLWIDEAAGDPAIPRIAEEIEAALQAHRLPVERALFRGVPDWLVQSAGQAFAPSEVDERRDAALVAILTDGRILARQYLADDRRARLDALLRSLSHWPRLAFVDFAAEPGELAAILAKHSLLRIAPAGLAAFLGGSETAKRKPSPTATGDAAWAAACALAPASVDELRAFQLRKRLGLATSPWGLRDLRAEAPGPPGRLQWQPQDRARRVNWLHAAEAQDGDEVSPGSLLGKALDFWEEVYDRELKERTGRAEEGSWLDTPAHQHLAMERALLSLWRDPGNGARELYRLHGGALRDLVETHLRDLAPADWGSPELLHLPWPWESLPGSARVMLQEMGLGGGMPSASLRRPGRLWLGLGLCLGLAVGALGAAGISGWRQPGDPPVIVHGPEKPADVWEETRSFSAGHWDVAVGTRKSQAVQKAPAGAQVAVRWESRKVRCVWATSESEEWNCGTLENPPPLPEFLRRRVVVLEARPGSPEADALAADLLDSGSADQVVVSTVWSLRYLLAPGLLVLPNSDWGKLRKALRFDGIRTVQQVWPGLKPVLGDPYAQLRGLPACRNGELLEEDGMTFVHVCLGTFTMGSAADDPQAEDDEKPAHEVTLSEFWIGKTEVTNAQYRSDHPDHEGPDTLPASGVTWDEAKTFCERHGGRLPTEAEWEYAARAGTQTPWSFGADESKLGEFAWFRENSGSEPHPVATQKPNTWGLYDMHGNVWEWVEDRYGGPYSSGPRTDPQGTGAGEYRTLRGGSFINTPWNLRSANRDWYQPSIRFRYIGFRCARSPRRQP